MGITIRGGTQIRDFSPDDTVDTFYLSTTFGSPSFQEIQDKAKEKWGDNLRFDDLKISAEHIHTECLGYDLHDPSDYTDFLVITYQP